MKKSHRVLSMFSSFSAAFLAITLAVYPAQAAVQSSATAQLDWSSFSYGLTNGATLTLTDGEPYSFSSTQGSLNGQSNDIYTPGAYGFTDNGAFGVTAGATSFTDATGSVSGAASTSAATLAASSAVTLNSGPSVAQIVASAANGSLFTVNQNSTLTMTIPYALTNSLISTNTASSYVYAVIDLYDIDNGSNNVPLTEALIDKLLTATGSYSANGILSLSWNLLAGTNYEFTVEGGTNASGSIPAPAPEPATLLLLALGLIGTGAARRKS